MKKKVLCIVLIAALVIGAAVLIIYKQRTGGKEDSQSAESANFDMEYSDRLKGVPVTETESNSSTIQINYGDAGFCRKTLGVVDNSDPREDLQEESNQTVGVYNVTFRGKDGKIFLATWTYNSFAYTISINDSYEGADIDEMTDYIESTR